MHDTNLIIDFDSTFVIVEALDALSSIALEGREDRDEIVAQIKGITQLGMEGKIDFDESLKRRLSLFSPTRRDIEKLVGKLKKSISPSIEKNREFIRKNKKDIYVITGGFEEYVIPVVKDFGIPPSHVLANKFTYDKEGRVSGFDSRRALAKSGGKVKAVNALKLSGSIFVIGDGYTDYEIKKNGAATSFWAYVENVRRESVVALSDRVVESFDEVVRELSQNRALSYPKEKMKVLLLENIHPKAVTAFEEQGYLVDLFPHALPEEELCLRIKDVSILGIRSKTKITKKVLLHADRLLAVGAFCIGTNQIEIAECARRGVVVFNAPYSNTRSVVELVIGEIIMLYRRVIDKNWDMHKGVWDKSATGAHEIRGKTLGIIGYGNIGSQLSVLCETLGMRVIFYDIEEKLALGNAKAVALDTLLAESDVITVHVDGRASNKNFIGKSEFAKMKKGVHFLNLSRGFVVDVDALAKEIKRGRVGGAAVDVYPAEPASNAEKFESTLRGLPNVILTPHIGGSTQEAQRAIGEFVSGRISQFVDRGETTLSVNFPQLVLPTFEGAHRIIHIHKNEVGVLASLNKVFAKHSINILGQYLSTNEDIGYVITDVDKKYDPAVLDALRSTAGTVKMRVLY